MRLLRFALFACVCSASAAQEFPDQAKLEEVNRLGQMLYAYDQAAWHGTDAVMPLLQAEAQRARERVRGYVAEPIAGGWRVGFGRLSPDSSGFLVAYEALLDSAYAILDAEAFQEPVTREGFPFHAMLALSAASGQFSAPERVTYNTAVLPAPDGLIYVYYLPAQPAINVYHVGADLRYTFDPATRSITSETRLHNALNTFDLREQPSVSTISTAVVTDIPTETDVFYAMSRPPAAPGATAHYILTENWVFSLGANGIAGIDSTETWRAPGAETGQ